MKSILHSIILFLFIGITFHGISQSEQDFTPLSKEIVSLIQNIETTPLYMDSTIQLTFEKVQEIMKNNPSYSKNEKLMNITENEIFKVRKQRNDAILNGEIYFSEKILNDDFKPTYLFKKDLSYFGHSSKFHSEEIEFCVLKVYFEEGNKFYEMESFLLNDKDNHRILFVDIPERITTEQLQKVEFDPILETVIESPNAEMEEAITGTSDLAIKPSSEQTNPFQLFFKELKTNIKNRDTTKLNEQIYLTGINKEMDSRIFRNLFSNNSNTRGDFAISTPAIDLLINEYCFYLNNIKPEFYSKIMKSNSKEMKEALAGLSPFEIKTFTTYDAHIILIFSENKWRLLFWENLNSILN